MQAPARTGGKLGAGRFRHRSVSIMTADFYPLRHEIPRRNHDADHQRGEGGEPGGVRRDAQAAGDDWE